MASGVKPHRTNFLTRNMAAVADVLVIVASVLSLGLVGYLEATGLAEGYPLYPLYLLCLIPVGMMGSVPVLLGVAALSGALPLYVWYLADGAGAFTLQSGAHAAAVTVTGLWFAWLLHEFRVGWQLSIRVKTTDLLTGAMCYSRFVRKMRDVLHHARDKDEPLSAIYVDCGSVAQTNEVTGIPAGDAVLRIVGRDLMATRRRHDLVARVVGNEFILCLPNTDYTQAGPLGAAIRDSLVRRLSEAGFSSYVNIGTCTFRYAPRHERAVLQKLREAVEHARLLGGNAVHQVQVTEKL